jgi:hypothetical protein
LTGLDFSIWRELGVANATAIFGCFSESELAATLTKVFPDAIALLEVLLIKLERLTKSIN